VGKKPKKVVITSDESEDETPTKQQVYDKMVAAAVASIQETMKGMGGMPSSSKSKNSKERTALGSKVEPGNSKKRKINELEELHSQKKMNYSDGGDSDDERAVTPVPKKIRAPRQPKLTIVSGGKLSYLRLY